MREMGNLLRKIPKTFVEKCCCCENRILSISRSLSSGIDGVYLCIDLPLEQLALLSYQIQKQLWFAD